MLQAVFTTMPMFVTLFWAIVLILRYRRSDRAKRILSVFMSVTTLLYFAHCVYFNREYALSPFADTVYSFATLAVYPLYYLYITSLTSSRRLTLRNYSILLPALLLSAAICVCYLVMSKAQRAEFVMDYLYRNSEPALHGIAKIQVLLHDAVKVVFAIQLIPVLCLGLRKIKRYNKLVMSYYSYTDNKSLYQIKNLLLIFVMTAVASFGINIIGKAYFADTVDLIIIPSVLFSGLLFSIGYIGTMIEFTADELSEARIANPEIVDMDTGNMDKLKGKIIDIVETQKLYLKPNLKISDLTQMISSNRNYIYNAINVGMGISFSEFVNRYRVTYAQKLITDSKKPDMNSIWVESGFSSESSFYRNFKLYAGCSPRRWKEKR